MHPNSLLWPTTAKSCDTKSTVQPGLTWLQTATIVYREMEHRLYSWHSFVSGFLNLCNRRSSKLIRKRMLNSIGTWSRLLYWPLLPTEIHLLIHLVGLIRKWCKHDQVNVSRYWSLNGNGLVYRRLQGSKNLWFWNCIRSSSVVIKIDLNRFGSCAQRSIHNSIHLPKSFSYICQNANTDVNNFLYLITVEGTTQMRLLQIGQELFTN